jgi:hypothetical protein
MGIVLANDRYKGRGDRRKGDMAKQDKPQTDAVFDGWLTHHLSRLYDPVIREPIPEDLLKLLEERLG